MDAKIAAVAPERARAIIESGRPPLLNRALHRREHLDHIEHALQR